MADSHRAEDHYGLAGEPQYRWFAEELRNYGRADVLRQNVPIYATGSAALKPEQRPPEVPNQYQVLRVTPRGIERMARARKPSVWA